MSKRWVPPEYLTEFAFIVGALTMFIPWNITYGSFGSAYILWLRFPLFQALTTNVMELAGKSYQFLIVLDAYKQQLGTNVESAFGIWMFAALFFSTLLVFLTLLTKFDAQITDISPFHPARIIGSVLTGTGGMFLLSNYLLFQNGIPATYIPIGAILILAFGIVLLTAELPPDYSNT